MGSNPPDVADSMYTAQRMSHWPVGLGFPHYARRHQHVELPFRPGVVGIVNVYKELYTRGGTLTSPGGAKSTCAGPSQLATSRFRCVFVSIYGGISQGKISFSSPRGQICRCAKRFLNWGRDPNLYGWRGLYILVRSRDRPVKLGFPHRARRYEPGGFL